MSALFTIAVAATRRSDFGSTAEAGRIEGSVVRGGQMDPQKHDAINGAPCDPGGPGL